MYTLSLHCHSVIEQLWRGNGISSVGWCLFIVWGDGVYVQIGSPGLCENAYSHFHKWDRHWSCSD